MLPNIYGSVNENEAGALDIIMSCWRDISRSIITEIKGRKLRWLGHIQGMKNDIVIRLLSAALKETDHREDLRWLDNVAKDLVETGTISWKGTTRNRKE